MSWRLGGRPLRRVLVTRLRYLGDVVLSTVVADLLRRGDASLEIGFLCEAAHAPVLTDHPSLRRVHLLGAARRGGDAAARATDQVGRGAGTLGMIRELRRARYDLAVDLFFNPRSAWLLRLAGIPLRIGGTLGGRRRLYTGVDTPETVADAGQVLRRVAPGTIGDHVCRLASLTWGDEELPFLDWLDRTPAGESWQPRIVSRPPGPAGREALAAAGIDPEGDWLLAAPGATWPAKEWPRLDWERLLLEVKQRTRLKTAVLVPPGDARGWSELRGALPPLPMSEVLGLVGRARALVTVDGGVMHAGIALGTPTVALFGPTDPAIWFPYVDRNVCRVLASRPACHPCDRHECPPDEFVCLPRIRPQEVVNALDEVLGATGGVA